MSWQPQEIELSSDRSSFLAVYDSLGTGVPIGGGASYQCNDTAMGFILDLPAIKPAVLIQSTQVSFPLTADYPVFEATFPQATTAGNLLIAIFTAQFSSALFQMACTDSTLVSWNAVFPTNGHVPGESNTLQVFLAIGVGGKPTVSLTQIGLPPTYSDMTAGSVVLLEYSGPNGTVAEYSSNYTVGGPNTVVLSDLATGEGDLLFQAISIMPACPNPNVVPIGGGFVSPPPSNVIIPPQNLGAISLPFCFSEKCRIFE
jgi:hypothetical protein